MRRTIFFSFDVGLVWQGYHDRTFFEKIYMYLSRRKKKREKKSSNKVVPLNGTKTLPLPFQTWSPQQDMSRHMSEIYVVRYCVYLCNCALYLSFRICT